MSSKVDIVEISPIKKNSPIVVTGFTGPGFIGNTSLLYIARQKGFTQRAQVKSHLIPPMMLLIEGKPTPVFRIYGDQKNEILLVVSEALINAENAWPIGIKLMEWLRGKGAKEIISIEGMPFATQEGERPIFGFSTSKRGAARRGAETQCALDDAPRAHGPGPDNRLRGGRRLDRGPQQDIEARRGHFAPQTER